MDYDGLPTPNDQNGDFDTTFGPPLWIHCYPLMTWPTPPALPHLAPPARHARSASKRCLWPVALGWCGILHVEFVWNDDIPKNSPHQFHYLGLSLIFRPMLSVRNVWLLIWFCPKISLLLPVSAVEVALARPLRQQNRSCTRNLGIRTFPSTLERCWSSWMCIFLRPQKL